MKGLLIKDFCLTKSNQRLYTILPILAVISVVTGNDNTFCVGYLTLVFAMMVMTSISYDEFDKSNAFLMTMPITRKTYVTEKYVFGLITSLIGWLVAVILIGLFGIFKGQNVFTSETLVLCIGTLYTAFLFLLIFIPVQLRFGGDNGKAVILALILSITILVLLIEKVSSYFSIDKAAIVQHVWMLPEWILVLLVVAVHAGFLFLSYFCSLRTIMRKQF